jgi:hypothetical protein
VIMQSSIDLDEFGIYQKGTGRCLTPDEEDYCDDGICLGAKRR